MPKSQSADKALTRTKAAKKAAGKPGSAKTQKAAEAGKRTGRPSKYDAIDKRQVEKLATAGWTDEQMADFFKVDKATWNRWKKKHADFCASLNEWKATADHKVERSLYERATGYEHPEDKIFNANGSPLVVPTIKHYPPDTTAAIFWLKNRQPDKWRDKQDHEHDVSDNLADLLREIGGTATSSPLGRLKREQNGA